MADGPQVLHVLECIVLNVIELCFCSVPYMILNFQTDMSGQTV